MVLAIIFVDYGFKNEDIKLSLENSQDFFEYNHHGRYNITKTLGVVDTISNTDYQTCGTLINEYQDIVNIAFYAHLFCFILQSLQFHRHNLSHTLSLFCDWGSVLAIVIYQGMTIYIFVEGRKR